MRNSGELNMPSWVWQPPWYNLVKGKLGRRCWDFLKRFLKRREKRVEGEMDDQDS